MAPTYPHIHVRLVGEDGNAYAIQGRMIRALRAAGVPQAEIDAFREEATASDYGHLLQTVLKTVDCD
jgi:hypothetical protein